MAAAGTVGSISVSLHPLVILNISEHWTRQRAQEGKPVQGILFMFIDIHVFIKTIYKYLYRGYTAPYRLTGKQNGYDIECTIRMCC